jgi:hypothetical protein
LRQHFLGCGIEDGHRLIAGNHFPVDEKVEIAHWLALPFERTDLEVSLYLNVYHGFDRRAMARWLIDRPKTGLDVAGKNDIFIEI